MPQAPQARSASPIGLATYPGTSPVTVVNANILHLLTTGVATGTAGPTSASSTVSSVSATLSRLASLGATAVSSSCTFNNDGAVSGTASLAGAAVHVLGIPAITLAAHPARNTTVSVPGVATLTLNKHSTATDGTLTVTAIYVSLLGSTQTLSLGVSVCNAADLAPVPVLPSKAMPFALGGLGVLLVAGVSYSVARRSRFRARRLITSPNCERGADGGRRPVRHRRPSFRGGRSAARAATATHPRRGREVPGRGSGWLAPSGRPSPTTSPTRRSCGVRDEQRYGSAGNGLGEG